MYGKWDWQGFGWHCDCGVSEILRVHHSNAPDTTGQLNPVRKKYCSRCQVSRPPMNERPKPPKDLEEFKKRFDESYGNRGRSA